MKRDSSLTENVSEGVAVLARRGRLGMTKWEFMTHRCPICKAPTDSTVHADFPFCSERCRLLDLGNWAAERYVVSEPVLDEDFEKPPDPPNPNDSEH